MAKPEKMKAGPQLDALIAEKVFGISDGVPELLPAFSQRIEAAWDVAQKCKIGVLPDGDAGWCAGFDADGEGTAWPERMLHGDQESASWCRAETAALAICRAALVRVELEAEAS